MPDDLPAALLVERIAFRRDRNDRRKIMASVRGVAPSEKHEGSLGQAARGLRGISSDAQADVAVLHRRAIFAWLIADGDLHLKNMGVLRVAPAISRPCSSHRSAMS